MLCAYCGTEKVIAKGLCRNCYYRLKKTGTLEYKRKGKAPQACSVDGCNSVVVARGYCDAHYRLYRKYGDTVSTFGYGERRKHPSYDSWRRQEQTTEGRVPEWNEFFDFCADVGNRPSSRHVARRYDPAAPWGPLNFYWKLQGQKAGSLKAQAKIWRDKNPMRAKGHKLKQKYGVSIERYAEMYEQQGGRCAICGDQGSNYTNGNGGDSNALHVDHCHETRIVRGLLCKHCNRALGGFKDSTTNLENAIKYLKKHESQP